MQITIIITGLQVTSRWPCWCGEEQKHFSPLGTVFSCKSFEILFIVLTISMAANCYVVVNQEQLIRRAPAHFPLSLEDPMVLCWYLGGLSCVSLIFLFPLNSRDDKKIFARYYWFHYHVIGYFQTSFHCVLLAPVVLITINCLT